MEEQIKTLEKRIEDKNIRFEEMIQMMREMRDQPGSSSNEGVNFTRSLGYVPKLEFPKFDRPNPRIWIKKCCKYFALCKIPEDQRVDLASLNMVDKAENWISSYLLVRKYVDWNDFVIDLNARFKDELGMNVVEQFNKLQQHDSLEVYIDEFENLRAIMLQNNHTLPDSYIMDSFVGGLKSAVKPFVRAFKPTSIAEAMEFARLQEESLSCMTTNSKPNESPFIPAVPLQSVPNESPFIPAVPLQSVPMLANTKPPLLPAPQNKPLLPTPPIKTNPPTGTRFNSNPTKTARYILDDVRAEKIAKGLCYYCDHPYDKNHKCRFKESQLFAVEISGNEKDNVLEVEQEIQERWKHFTGG